VVSKAQAFADLFEIMRAGMELCASEEEPGNEALATFMELQSEQNRLLKLYNQIQPVLQEAAPEVVDAITATLEEMATLRQGFQAATAKK